MTQKPEKLLYILMRTDLASMNPGKAVAQGAHAANQFVEHHGKPAKSWQGQSCGFGFGTTIVLGVTIEDLRHVNQEARKFGLPTGIVKDPTYPLRDGEFTHLIPLETCGYVFGTREECSKLLGYLELMP